MEVDPDESAWDFRRERSSRRLDAGRKRGRPRCAGGWTALRETSDALQTIGAIECADLLGGLAGTTWAELTGAAASPELDQRLLRHVEATYALLEAFTLRGESG